MIGHDLVRFPGAFISLTSIHGVADEIDFETGETTGSAYIDYGQGNRLMFKGCAEDIMGIIDQWVDQQPNPKSY